MRFSLFPSAPLSGMPSPGSRSEPILLLDGDPPLGESTMDARPPAQVRRRLGNVVVVLGLAVLVASQLGPDGAAPVPGGVRMAAQPATVGGGDARAAEPYLVVIAPETPGEVVGLLRYQQGRFCGEVHAFLDGVRIDTRVMAEVDPHLLFTFEVPRFIAPGPHELKLVSGRPAPKTGGPCRDDGHHRRPVAMAIIDVRPHGHARPARASRPPHHRRQRAGTGRTTA